MKNPLLSLWLSMANRVGGSLRGQAAARVRRQTDVAMTEATRQGVQAWADAVKPIAARRKKKR